MSRDLDASSPGLSAMQGGQLVRRSPVQGFLLAIRLLSAILPLFFAMQGTVSSFMHQIRSSSDFREHELPPLPQPPAPAVSSDPAAPALVDLHAAAARSRLPSRWGNTAAPAFVPSSSRDARQVTPLPLIAVCKYHRGSSHSLWQGQRLQVPSVKVQVCMQGPSRVKQATGAQALLLESAAAGGSCESWPSRP